MSWLRYSGASIAITLNPLHWRLIPQADKRFRGDWPGPNEHSYYATWLFLTVRLWIDDGSW